MASGLHYFWFSDPSFANNISFLTVQWKQEITGQLLQQGQVVDREYRQNSAEQKGTSPYIEKKGFKLKKKCSCNGKTNLHKHSSMCVYISTHPFSEAILGLFIFSSLKCHVACRRKTADG